MKSSLLLFYLGEGRAGRHRGGAGERPHPQRPPMRRCHFKNRRGRGGFPLGAGGVVVLSWCWCRWWFGWWVEVMVMVVCLRGVHSGDGVVVMVRCCVLVLRILLDRAPWTLCAPKR